MPIAEKRAQGLRALPEGVMLKSRLALREMRVFLETEGPPMSEGTPLLIPTPKSVQALPGPAWRLPRDRPCRVACRVAADPRTRLAAKTLEASLLAMTSVRPVLISVPEWPCQSLAPDFTPDIVFVIAEPPYHGNSFDPGSPEWGQGYSIRTAATDAVVLESPSSLGLLYAVSTLDQMWKRDLDGWLLPPVEIHDAPAFRYRGCNWNLFGEVGGWSQDRGDGLIAYERRVRRKLDLCQRFRINVIIMDGVGWDPDRFPGYAAMMRRLNRYARLRGIHLLYVGYGSGYGAGCTSGDIFRNRECYPDGPVYRCCGSPDNPETNLSRTMGTCLSNLQLLRLKQEQLERYVRLLEPGALYIHNLDVSAHEESVAAWRMRCPACRRRWPNDEPRAVDGMAGAFTWFYDQLADAVNRVRHESSDYVASRDCLLFMVSPNYTSATESDVEWQAHCDYFTTLAAGLRNRNIVLGLREQFVHRTGPGYRCAMLRDRVERGSSHKAVASLGSFVFSGGDGYNNSLPLIATPVLTQCFMGVDAVIHANGNAFQEPQLLLNAEYCWNPTGSSFHREVGPQGYDAFMRRYRDLSNGSARPAGIFGPGGFLDHACDLLYGPAAGPAMAAVLRLRGRRSLTEQWPRMDRPSVLVPCWNLLLPGWRFSVFRRSGIVWQRELHSTASAMLGTLPPFLKETRRLNLIAVKHIEKALRGSVSPDVAGDLCWAASCLKVGAHLASHTATYVEVFRRAHAAALTGHDRNSVLRDVRALRRRLAGFVGYLRRTVPGRPLDAMGGETGFRERTVRYMIEQLGDMAATLTTRQWSPPPASRWW